MNKEPEDFSDLSIPEQDAFALSQAAIMLDQAKGDPKAVAAALDHNLQLWVSIRTLVSRPNNLLPGQIKDNLKKLANYVADTTFKHGGSASEQIIDSLININLQISQGLLEGNR